MSDSRRHRGPIIVVILLLLLLLALVLVRCSRRQNEIPPAPETPRAAGPAPAPATPAPGTTPPAERLTPATLQAPTNVVAGVVVPVAWTGPDNSRDFVTIVKPDASSNAYANYRETREGTPLNLTAPIEPGAWEIRYVTFRSHTVLARRPLTVIPAGATLEAPATVTLGSVFSVTWTGPDNAGDYLTIVPRTLPEGQYGNFTYTRQGSPLQLTAPVETGDAEIRYMTGQGDKVIGRRPITVIAPKVTVSAHSPVIAGSLVKVTWSGPGNSGDYVTIVTNGTPDGRYANYANVTTNPTVNVTAPIDTGDAEIRYMTGPGAKVLARAPLKIIPATITLEAPAEVKAGTPVTVTWTGPANSGDYLTIVPKALPDGRYAAYANAAGNPSLTLKAPAEAGPGEIRYMSGQGAHVLARRPITLLP